MKFRRKKNDKRWNKAIERANDVSSEHTTSGPAMVTTLLNAACVEPTEIQSFRATLDQGRIVGTEANPPQVGIVLTLGLSRTLASHGVVIPIDLPVGMSRDSVVAVHEMLSKWLADNGHYHWYTGEEVERAADSDLRGEVEDVQIQVPDDLTGLG